MDIVKPFKYVLSLCALVLGVVLMFVVIALSGFVVSFVAGCVAIILVLFIVGAVLFALPTVRRQYVTKPLFNAVKLAFPEMSQTEREAIAAGGVWWEADLFSGNPDWSILLNLPQATLTAQEREFLDDKVEQLCSMLDEWDIHQQKDLPAQVWEFIKKERFFGMNIPTQYGGLAFSAFANSTIVMKIATQSPVTAITTMVPNSLGPAELLLKYGTHDQKNYYLPRLACGEEVPCFGLTSLDAGSDAGSMVDEGVVCHGDVDGETVLGMRLNFDKRYITLAPVATLIGLAFKLYDPDHLIGEQENKGITLALIPATTAGIEIGDRHNPMNVPFMNGPVRGKDVFVPLTAIIGGSDMAGHGWRMLMACLSAGRGVSLPAMSTASAKVCYQTAGAYARIRRQFKIPVSQFEGVQESLANIAGRTYMVHAMREFICGGIMQGENSAIASAIAKYHMTEMARDCINESMDIHGGKGIQSGPNNYLFSAYNATPVGITVEGANIMTRNLMIFGQGAIRCHPFLLQEMQLFASDAPDVVDQFDQLLKHHVPYALGNVMRSFVYGITGGLMAGAQAPKPLRQYTRPLTRISCALALLSDLSFAVLGGQIKRKEALSARLGDVLSYLLIASSVIKHFSDQGFPKEQSDYVRWSVRYCLWHAQEAIIGFLDNFPKPALAFIVKKLIFPWGRAYQAPSDQLHHEVAKHMVEKGDVRAHLLEGVFINRDQEEARSVLESAFEKVFDVSLIIKKINQAVANNVLPARGTFGDIIEQAVALNLISESEAQDYLAYELLKNKALSVNEFDPQLNKVLR
jgi:acyl-CoA dehydrogenase